MTQSIAVLGRQPALGLAELESLFGADKMSKIGQSAALLDLDATEIPFSRLGGTIKLARLLTFIDGSDWGNIEAYLLKTIPEHLKYVPEGKFKLGLSVYDLAVSPSKINATGLSIKKAVKSAGRSARIIPNKETALNTAQVLHNKLTSPTGWELLLIKDGNRTVLAQTVEVQDIDAYAARDQKRPKRDARVGMLPPKLAQTIVNMAVDDKVKAVLDPFCGTGVILQEAILMGYDVYGSDIEERMIDYSNVNLEWLAESHDFLGQTFLLETGDATTHGWQAFDTIACETYLGRPFSALPKPEVLAEVMQDVDTIHKKFLRNVAKQTKPGFRMCIAVPSWKTKSDFKHLKTLDSLEELGYTRLSFVHASHDDLVYHREGQIVARELVVLIRK